MVLYVWEFHKVRHIELPRRHTHIRPAIGPPKLRIYALRNLYPYKYAMLYDLYPYILYPHKKKSH